MKTSKKEESKMLRRIPKGIRILIVLAVIFGLLLLLSKFWIPILIGGLFWILVWAFAHNQPTRHSGSRDINIDINQTDDTSKPQSWVRGGLGTNYYAPRINQKGVDFITGRRKRKQ